MAGQILLRGTMHITVIEIDELYLNYVRKFFNKFVEITMKVVGFKNTGSKLYTTIYLDKVQVGRTRLLEYKDSKSQWNESFHIYSAHKTSNVVFSIEEYDPLVSTFIGKAYLPVQQLQPGEEIDTWLEILDKSMPPIKEPSKIHVKIQYFDVTREQNCRGIISEKHTRDPYIFFSKRTECKFNIYQDSYTPDCFISKIAIAGGKFDVGKTCLKPLRKPNIDYITFS